MQFELTQEQRLLQASAFDWLRAHAPPSPAPGARRGGEAGAEGDRWAAFAAMGWLGLPFAEEDGGYGGGAVDVGLLLQAFGAHLAAEPFVSSIVVGGHLLAALGSGEQRARLLPALMDGTARVALAHSEPAVHWPWAERRFQARRDADGWRLHGEKQLVESAQLATHWLVTARCDEGCERVFLVEAGAAVERLPYRIVQGGHACDLRFDALHVAGTAMLGGGAAAHEPALRHALSLGVIAQCWGALGVLDMLLAQTVSYVRERRQFGRPLSDFQAVQHKLAEMGVARADARAACELAALRLAPGDDGTMLAAAAKATVGCAAEVVGKHAVQLHGAMGVCDELPVAPAYRWLEGFQAQWGRPGMHASFVGRGQLQGERFAHSAVLEPSA
jgi:alkylation response protein AidB-like acyl-CoA dehydrogenase